MWQIVVAVVGALALMTAFHFWQNRKHYSYEQQFFLAAFYICMLALLACIGLLEEPLLVVGTYIGIMILKIATIRDHVLDIQWDFSRLTELLRGMPWLYILVHDFGALLLVLLARYVPLQFL